MKIIRMNEVEGKKNHRGVTAKKLIQHQHTTVMNLILNPGEIIPEHSVPVDVFFYVVDGKGTIQIGEEEAVVGEKDIILCPRETTMALKADQGQRFEVLNVKTPSIKY
ncbi:cupin domain-containing protein [Dethiobacter alkaliphilus]|uniref:cupin domain-containing protein n=1 Tax=Dethiobacter alkaliphilus TaxID=427926 RepID=UPI0022274628|nr:cupin domain-containing protein [Dethiobacter alkaliphilus]MCW3489210.1 cupin domain-containing protein [Dethiobacter alkaliphilus]